MANDTSADIAAAFAEITRAIAAADDIESTLGRISQLAVLSLDGCDHAGVTVHQGDRLLTKGATSDVVEEVDRVQYALREGPCADAVVDETDYYSSDLRRDPRWPRFGPTAAERGLASLLSLHLFKPDRRDRSLGALNMYGTRPDAFTERDRAVAAVLAAHASIALAAAGSSADLQRANVEMREALESRDVIGQAKGILMERHRITAEEAFDMLRRASQHLNVKLREVAQDLADTGAFPARRPPT
jgi:GAF domain-containing protein